MNWISGGLKATLLTTVFLGAGLVGSACADAQEADSQSTADVVQGGAECRPGPRGSHHRRELGHRKEDG